MVVRPLRRVRLRFLSWPINLPSGTPADFKRHPPVPACVLRAGPRAPGARSDSAMEEQSIHRRSNRYTPTLHNTWYGLICTTIQGSLKGGGAEGWQKGPHASRRENTREGTQSTERPGTKYPLQFIFNIKTGKLAPTTDSQHKFRLKDTLNTHKQKAWINM